MTQPQISDELFAVATETPYTPEEMAAAQQAIDATGVNITPAQGVLLRRLITLHEIRQDLGGES